MKHKKRIIFIAIAALLLLFTLAAAQAVTPGAESDPLVTLSYIEKRLTSLMTSIDQVYAKKGESGGTAQQSLYEVVFVKAGQSLVLGASSEMILRSGTATAIASFNGGLSDLTGGVDLAQDVKLITNHLILVPRDDGRGLKAVTDCYVMVRGSHIIVQ